MRKSVLYIFLYILCVVAAITILPFNVKAEEKTYTLNVDLSNNKDLYTYSGNINYDTNNYLNNAINNIETDLYEYMNLSNMKDLDKESLERLK